MITVSPCLALFMAYIFATPSVAHSVDCTLGNKVTDWWILHTAGHQFDQGYNTLRRRQNGWHFSHNMFKRIFFNENVWISITISPKPASMYPMDNKIALVQAMAWRRTGDKPLPEPIGFRSRLVILCNLRYLMGNISPVMTKHMGVQRKLHHFAYLIVQIILCFYS